jgi:ParB family chromosome partitioning protein
MATKAKTKKKEVPATEPATALAVPDGGRFEEAVLISDIKPSPSNPRRRIDDATIAELAASIGTVGVLEPLLIRANGKGYELVCGERRWRAAQVAKILSVPAIVRDLTDEQVLDIQIHENLHREDVHPMDEAYGYQFLRDKLGCDVKELALRVGKSEKYILNRLKLNTLIKEAQDDIDAGHLPLVYALEIAKYSPEAQEMILEEGTYVLDGKWVKDGWVYTPVKTKLRLFGEFKGWIDERILRLLSSAPFDKKSTELRKDGLACVACPDRTGANIGLFEANQIGKKDACLNPACWQGKAETHVQITRESIAKTAEINANDVPLVNTAYWSDRDGVLGRDSFVQIVAKKKNDYDGTSTAKCGKTVRAVEMADGKYGTIVDICPAESGCKIHHKNSSSSSGAKKSSKSDEQLRLEKLEEGRKRREEIWDSKIAEIVRRRVLADASKIFTPQFAIHAPFEGFLQELVARFKDQSSFGGQIVDSLCELAGIKDRRRTEDEKELAQILFFYIHCSKGEIGYGNYWRSQKDVKKIAQDYGINYRLIDAETRVAESSKKALKMHQEYLDAVQSGDEKAAIPRQFSDKYKTKD